MSPTKKTKNKLVISVPLNLHKINGFVVMYVIGIYGFPSFTFDSKSYYGLMVRISYLISFIILIAFFLYNQKKANRNEHKKQMVLLDFRLFDLLTFSAIFLFLLIYYRRELHSSITGDENAVYGASIEYSHFLLEKIVAVGNFGSETIARYLIGLNQILVIFLVIVIFIATEKLIKKHKLVTYLFSLIGLQTIHNYIFGGSYSYPNLETVPYFFISPIVLLLNLNPKVISIFIFSLFAFGIFKLLPKELKILTRGLLLVTLLTLNILWDMTLSINHSSYYFYIVTLILVKWIFSAKVSSSFYLLALIFSCLRSSTLPIIILIFYLDNRNELKFKYLKEIFIKHRDIFSGIMLIQIPLYFGKLIDLLFSLGISSGETDFTFYNRFRVLGLSLLGYKSFFLLLLLILFIGTCLKKHGIHLIVVFLLSFCLTSLTAPIQNLGNPFYNAEILAPYLFISLIFLTSIKTRLVGAKLTEFIKVLFLLFVLFLNYSEARKLLMPNFSWGSDYQLTNSGTSNRYFTNAKVSYAPVLAGINSKYINCRFMDVTYNSPFLLASNITSSNFVSISKSLTINFEVLEQNNGISCVVVGNYPNEKFVDLNLKFTDSFVLSESFRNEYLHTVLYIYRR